MGEEGLVEVEYVGQATRPLLWQGPITKWAYEFGGDVRIGYMDVRDAQFMEKGPFRCK